MKYYVTNILPREKNSALVYVSRVSVYVFTEKKIIVQRIFILVIDNLKNTKQNDRLVETNGKHHKLLLYEHGNVKGSLCPDSLNFSRP